MKSFSYAFFILVFSLISCKSDSEKADQLRIENKFDEAADLYRKAAAAGDSYAKWRLSNAYANGDGVDWNDAKALDLLKQSAKEGCVEAKCDLGYAYLFDWYGIGKDVEKGKAILDELVENTDNSFVLSKYAALLLYGQSPYEQNKEKAIRLLEKVKDKENPYYCATMGDVYLGGTDKIDINVSKGVEFLEKAFYNGKKSVAFGLVRLYRFGYEDIKKNEKKYIEWINRGIEANVSECMLEMASLCLGEDTTIHVNINPHKGIELIKKATKRGNGKAFFHLGNLYFNGEHVAKDDSKAVENWEKAAELKDPDGACLMGDAYIVGGVGLNLDFSKGIDYYKQAVDYGSGTSANNLFIIYWTGNCGVPKNIELARKYLFKSAELGDDWGCYNLGKQYYNGGELVEKNVSQAFVYIKKAADMGLIDACNTLAYLYENGIGVEKNPQKAKEYKDKTVASKSE